MWPWSRPKAAEPPRKPGSTLSRNGRPIGHPTNERAAEKRRQQLADARTRLELARLQRDLLQLENPGGQTPLDAETIERVVEFLRSMGLVVVPKGGGKAIDEGGGVREWVDALKAALPLVQQMLVPQPPAAAIPVAPASPPPSEAPLAIAAPAPAPAVPGTAAPAVPWQLAIVLNRLGGMAPSQAAAWLAGQTDPQLRQWLEVLGSAPEGQVWPVLEQVAAAVEPATGQPSPQVVAVVGWLRQRPDWTEAVAAELRGRAASGQNGASG